MIARIAIIGEACRVAGANDLEQFWRLLETGTSAITEIPAARWRADTFYDSRRGAPGKSVCKWGGFLDKVDCFDNGFFSISAREARSMDPQQRLLLEETWHCLEDAGVRPARLRGARVGVFAAVMAIDYHQNVTTLGTVPDAYAPLGNYSALLANRLSHFYGWTGESQTVDAACASSLVALHAARRALLDGTCDYAIVAAASLILNPWKYIAFSQAGMLSPDGHCHTFDAAANGYVPGEGAVVVMLQREADAQRDGNRIDGFVLGTAVNHGGGGGTITAPVAAAQTEVIRRAADSAGVPFDSIGYVEAHGTGTPLGDPIEVDALIKAFRTQTTRTGFCRIGSVKTNIGHLEAAAGLAGLVKVLLMMRRRRIARTLNLERVNPLITFNTSPFVPALTASDWLPGPMRAGVSSFGFGGANAHCVLEGVPDVVAGSRRQHRPRALPFLLSAASPASLGGLLEAWQRLASDPGFDSVDLSDVCQTLMLGRQALPMRRGAVVANVEDLSRFLADSDNGTVTASPRPALRIGAVAPLPSAVFAELAKTMPPVGQRHRAAVEAIGHPSADPATEAFLQGYALGGALLDLGVRPALIAGSGGGRYAALALAEILPLTAAAQWSRGDGKARSAHALARPRIHYFDDVSGRILAPLNADRSYFDALLSGLREATEIPPELLTAARDLHAGNNTFNTDLGAWQTALGGRGDLRKWLDTPPTEAAQQRILLLFLVWSRAKLRRRWGLVEPAIALPIAFGEVAALLCEGLLDPGEAVALAGQVSPDLLSIAGRVATQSDMMDPATAPPLLRAHAAGLPEITDPAEWLAAPPAMPVAMADSSVVIDLDAGATRHVGTVALKPGDDAERGFLDMLVTLWCRGVDLDFEPLRRPYRTLRLPQMVFERHRHWIDRPQPDAPETGAPPTRIVWRNKAIVADHRIGGRALVPAAAMLLQAVRRAPARMALAEVTFPRPAVVEDTLEATFEQAGDDFAWRTKSGVICRGHFAQSAEAALSPPPPGERVAIDAGGFYRRCAAEGHDYGPSLRVIQQAWRAQAHVVVALDACLAGMDAATALLDGALQAVLLAAEGEDPAPGRGLLLPWHIGSVQIIEPLATTVQAVVTRPMACDGGIVASVTMLGSDGRPLAVLRDCRFRAAAGKASGAEVPLFAAEWATCPEAILRSAPSGAVLLADRTGVAQRLAARLPDSRIFDGRDEFNVGAMLAALPEPREVFLLWGLDDAPDVSSKGFDGFSQSVLMPGLGLFREIAKRNLACRLRIVTRGHQTPDGEAAPAAPFVASVTGLGRSAAREVPALSVTMIDLPGDTGDRELDVLARCFVADADLAVRGDRCLRLGLRRRAPPLAGQSTQRLRAGGTYLVVGGLDGVGRVIATRIMQATAGHVFVVGRRPPAETHAALAALYTAAGRGSAEYLQGDIGDAEDVARIIAAARATAGHIDGVVNSAMVLEDGRCEAMDGARFDAALRPKILGDLNLVQALRARPPDFLISFSSVLARSGNAGQTNYVAACATQTAMACHHAAEGLPVCSIEWGYWGDSGRVASEAYRLKLAHAGLMPLGDDAGWAAFEAVLTEPTLPATVIAARLGAEWRGPATASATPTLDDAWAWAVDAARRSTSAAGSLIDVQRMNAALDAYGAATLLSRLQAAGHLVHPTPLADLRARAAPLPRHQALLDAALRILERHDYLTSDGTLLRITARAAEVGADAARLGIEIDRDYPSAAGPRGLLDHCLARWIQVLAGEVPATEVLFPGGSMDRVLGFYRGNPLADRCNELTATTLLRWAEARLAAGAERLRILELGAGTGATTEVVLAALAPVVDRIEFVYTDISPAFLNYGRQRFGPRHPGLRYERLDLEAPPEQTAALGSFDAVFATNVVHATRDIAHSLGHIAERLRPGGLLVLNELTRGQDLLTLTFGLLDGWWRFMDARLPDGPLLDPALWRQALAARFDLVEFVAPDAADTASQSVVIARRSPTVRQPVSAPAALQAPVLPDERPRITETAAAPDQAIAAIRSAVAEALGIGEDGVEDNTLFTDIGVDSIVSADVIYRIETTVGRRLGPTLLNDNPTPWLLAKHLATLGPGTKSTEPLADKPETQPRETAEPTVSARTLRRLIVNVTGKSDGVEIVNEPHRIPAPGPGEVEVAVSAAGLNFHDVMLALGRLPDERDPALGLEFAGRITVVGDGVAGLAEGDAVFGVSPGSFADRVIVRVPLVAPLPVNIGMQAAALPIVFLTAMRALEDIAGIGAGQTVLIHAGAGGVGLAALQVARRAGARVFATAGSIEKRRYLADLGVTKVMDSRSLDFADEVFAETGGAGVDVVIGANAGAFVDRGLAVVREGGWYLELGKTDRRDPAAVAATHPGVRYLVYDLLTEMLDQPALVGRTLQTLVRRLNDGSFVPLPVRTYPFSAAREAFRSMARAEHIGKIVLEVGASATTYAVLAPPVAASPPPAPVVTPAAPSPGAIAVVGAAGRFPGAPDMAALWRLLSEGRTAVSEVPPGRWSADDFAAFGGEDREDPLLRRGGFIADAECFDADFFQLSAREVQQMDPQQRVLLEEVWNALADAGHPETRMAEPRCGVFVGASAGDYAQKLLLAGQPVDGLSLINSLPSSLASRIAYAFDLNGPAMVIDMGCTSGLAALQAACESLRRGESNIAVAAAVSVFSTPQLLAQARAAGILSRSGRCAAFAQDSDGMVLSEAAVAFVLKPLDVALAAGDAIHGVIREVGVNHDGATNGFATPASRHQTRLQRDVLKAGKVPHGTISYIEGHGVGSRVGDTTELWALKNAFAEAVPGSIALGSVKANVGHTVAAAGLVSLAKVLLQMRHETIAPSPQPSDSAPRDLLAGSPFKLATEALPWLRQPGSSRRATVNGFAINGSNGFAVIEEAPDAATPAEIRIQPAGLPFLLAAHTEAALHRRITDLATWLEAHEVALADLARSLAMPSRRLGWRAAFIAGDRETLQWQLQAAAARKPPRRWRIGAVSAVSGETAPVLSAVAQRLVAEGIAEADATAGRAKLLAGAELFVAGHDIDLGAVLPAGPRLSLLPPYPFERVRFWPEPAGTTAGPAPTTIEAPRRQAVAPTVRGVLAALLHVPVESVPVDRPLDELGVESILAIELCQRLHAAFGVQLEVSRVARSAGVGELAALVEAARQDADGLPGPCVADVAAAHLPFPLSDIQFAYWVGRSGSLTLGGNGCQIYWEFEQSPGWEIARLEAAWRHLVACHGMLRMVVDADGQQRVLAEVPDYRFDIHDWRGMTPDAATRALESMRGTIGQIVFDPSRWPLFHLALSYEDGRMRLHLSLDLLIADVMSVFKLLGQLARVYRDGPAVVAAPALGFRDCLLHMRRQESGPGYAKALAYWRQEVETLPPAPHLPQTKTADALDRPRVRRYQARLTPGNWAALRDQARLHGLTPVTAILQVFAEVLGHWASEPRFTVNLTVHGRPTFNPAIRDVIGDFTSTLLLAVDTGTSSAFGKQAAGLGQRLAAHLDHAQVSGVRVLRLLAERSPNERPLMPVVFSSTLGFGSLLGTEAGTMDELGQLSYGVTRTPQVWLDCQLYEDADGLLLVWDAIDSLFPDGLIGAMFTAYSDLLQRLALDPPLWEAALGQRLLAEERERRAASNATDAPIDPGLLHDGFVQQALTSPEHVAILAPDRTLSYGTLLAHAAGVAARLEGATSNSLIAVAMPKGWQQIVAVLAVSLAGAAYLPLDPAFPRERRDALLKRSAARRVLTSGQSTSDWPDGVDVINVEAIAPAGGPLRSAAPRCASTDLAYVIFTSGSTGEPKGVMIDHRGALNTVRDINARFDVGHGDRVLALSALGFDLSVYDIFGTLAAGGAIVVPRQESQADAAYLADQIASQRVTIWNSVPLSLQILLDDLPDRARLTTLRLVLLSGDWIPLTLPPACRTAAPNARLVSLGGATEASIWSIMHLIEEVDPAWPSVPYGRPMRNQRFYVLDGTLEECRDWIPGELFIGGIGLAQGYWRDPERTTASFIHHPRTGERLYRTGDIGRYRDDGMIEFLGRRDAQVKVNGYRVELGEIETVARRHPTLREAVAVTCAAEGGGRRIVLFAGPKPAANCDADAVRAFLAAQLPAYMLPSRIEILDGLPLNTNGKLDRNALAARAATRSVAVSIESPAAASQPALAQPTQSSVEQALIALWRGLLDRPDIDPTVNLAELGTDSMAVVEANRRIRQELGLPCTVTDIFEHPTLRTLARHLIAAPVHDAAAVPEMAHASAPESDQSRPHRLDQRRRFRAQWR